VHEGHRTPSPVPAPKRIRFYDSTLRDGAQAPGVGFNLDEQLRIATALDDMGMDEIETGFAASGPKQREDMRAIAALGLRAPLLSLARPLKADVDHAVEAGVGGVILVASVSDVHLTHKLRRDYTDVLAQALEAVEYARSLGLFVQLSAEDATRAPVERLLDLAKRAEDHGAMRIGLADTVGVATPSSMGRLVSTVRDGIGIPLSVHCHNDFGLAVANSLAAVEAGADVLSTTQNGLGERGGNAGTEECAAALELLYGAETGLRLDRLTAVSRLVSECSGVAIPPNKGVVGGNSFRHESGIHVAAMLRHPSCYEAYEPALVGGRREYVLGKTSGRTALRHLVGLAGDELDDDQCRQVLDEIKRLSEEKGHVDAEALQTIVERCRTA
jgi:methanogen homocitrate synthase